MYKSNTFKSFETKKIKLSSSLDLLDTEDSDSNSSVSTSILDMDNPVLKSQYNGKISYANKGENHCIEHVYSLHRRDLRELHWKECVLSSCSDDLARSLATAEATDCLSTVTLAWAGKDWGTSVTEKQLAALKEGQSAQVMDEEYRWMAMDNQNNLDELLKSEIKDKDKDFADLQKLYNIECYVREARRRLQAVNCIVDRISDEDQKKIKENDVMFGLMKSKLEQETGEKRPKLFEKVVLYHWFLKTNLFTSPVLPMV